MRVNSIHMPPGPRPASLTLGQLTVRSNALAKPNGYQDRLRVVAVRSFPNSYCPVTSTGAYAITMRFQATVQGLGSALNTRRSWQWRCWSPAGIPISGAQWLKAFATTATRSPWWVPAAATSRSPRRNSTWTPLCATPPTRPASPRHGDCSPSPGHHRQRASAVLGCR